MVIAATIAAVLAFYGMFYRRVVRHWGGFVQPLLSLAGLYERHPVRDVEAVGRLAAAGLAQIMFAAALVLALGVRLPILAPAAPLAPLVLLGGALGVGLLALASLLCTAVLQMAAALRSGAHAATVDEWLTTGQGGWMAQFRATARVAPAWASILIIGLYVSVEEIIFRGVLIDLMRGAGSAVAIVVSTALFVCVQAFNMPSLRAATFSMIGAGAVGLVHGLLYWHVPQLLPLIISHLLYFAGTFWLSPGRYSA